MTFSVNGRRLTDRSFRPKSSPIFLSYKRALLILYFISFTSIYKNGINFKNIKYIFYKQKKTINILMFISVVAFSVLVHYVELE